MKIWVNGVEYTDKKNDIIVIHVTEQFKKNINNMCPECTLYCEYDDKVYKTSWVKTLLTKLKKKW